MAVSARDSRRRIRRGVFKIESRIRHGVSSQPNLTGKKGVREVMLASHPILLLKKLIRFVGTWLGFTGLYGLTGGTCPCCGQPTCPVGLAGAGFVGGILAMILHLWRLARQPRHPLKSVLMKERKNRK